MSLTITYANQDWTLIGLNREQDPYCGPGWVAEWESEGDTSHPDGMMCYRLDPEDPAMYAGVSPQPEPYEPHWAIHYLDRSGVPQFSHGYGSMGITMVPVLPRPLAEALDMILGAGFEDGDDVREWGLGRLLPALLERHGQLRLIP
jgi:hypothetical protein